MSATPQPAATVILLRDASPSPEVLLIERHAKSDFLPDLYVFPGGRVEPEDRTLGDRLHGARGPDGAEAFARVKQFDADSMRTFYVAAIRETFEEAGILLARREGEEGLLDASATEAMAEHRLTVQSGELSFGDLVRRERLELAADRLAVHAHWITPEMVPRRFDTLFFTALTPPGQRARHDGVEATDHVWIRPEDALEQMEAGHRQIIFPTAQNLQTLCGFADAAAALESSLRRPVIPVLPRLTERDGRRVLAIPPEAGYAVTEQPLPEAPARK